MQSASVPDAFERALDAILARVCVSAPASSCRSLAVAFSGGLDSSVLLRLAQRYAHERGIALFAFHIHHGLSANADHWQAHCERECAQLGVRFDTRRVALSGQDKSGTEQAARISRYAALGDLCRLHRVPLLLTAHHLDDQAETVLMQLLRGSGVAGLSAMELANTAVDLLGDSELVMGRPLLGIARADLERFAAASGVLCVEDESNLDARYTRNALRHQVMPSLTVHFPGFQERFARAAQHAQSAQRLLNELAAQDFAACREGECIDIDALTKLGQDRADNLLRYWLALRGVRMPSTSWLSEMRSQLLESAQDAQPRVTHPDCEIRRHRGRIFLTPRADGAAQSSEPFSFRWRGEARIDFPLYGGSLRFEAAEQGVDATWLREQELVLRHRSGGEKLKPASNRPTRSLKHHYQALDIPAWERLRLPVVCAADGQLLFAAGIGMNWYEVPTDSGRKLCFFWEPFIS